MAKTNQAGADQAPATLEEAVALANDYKAKLATVETAAEESANTYKDSIASLEKSSKDSKEALEKANGVIDSLKAELEDAANVIEELKAQVTEAGKGKKKGPVVTIGKKSYLVTGGTVIKQKSYKPEDIAADKELCKRLIEKGSTLLKEID